MAEHEVVVTGTQAGCTCGWSWDSKTPELAKRQRATHLKWQGLGYKKARAKEQR